jgi:threonine dehydrogenase-like Zn-dependent dehydrogenase
MRGAIIYGPGDVRFESRPDPEITEPTDAIVRISATCICGSNLWDYRGINPIEQPTPIGHEYCGIVEEVGRDVRSIKRGQFVIGSFFASDNTIRSTRPGGFVGYVGVPHGVELSGTELFFAHVGLLGGPAPVRAFSQVAEGYRAMNERGAIKALLRP